MNNARPKATRCVHLISRMATVPFEGGWAGINWPVEYGGRGLNDIQQMIW